MKSYTIGFHEKKTEVDNKRSFIPISKPYLDESEILAASRAIRSGWVTQGPEVTAFEVEFAELVGAPYACAVSNCTTALHLALLAVGVRPGDEVITVSHSFIATANSIRYCGAIPIFVDIQSDTFNIDPEKIEEVINQNTRAILCVHQMGMPCNMQAIVEIARVHNLPVVEDAACAIGSEIYWNRRWEKIGKPHGDIACFSFHPRKLVTTGDGGMITTAKTEWDQQFRLFRQHGMSVPDSVRHGSPQVIFETYETLGYNYRMTDIQAAVGREQLRRLPDFIEQRREQAQYYFKILQEIPGLGLPRQPEWARSNWQSFCVRLPKNSNQRKVMQSMLDQGVATRRGIMNAHREAAYTIQSWSCGKGPGRCGCPPMSCKRLVKSENVQDECILIPLYHEMTPKDQDRVAKSLENALL